MEPQQGGEQLAWGPPGAGAACLCPAAVASSAAGNVFPRQALEQEMLRRAELQLQLQVGGGDRRRERKMKNRESAARSRLRRMAYVSELEKEVSLLRAEKEELAKLCQELKEAAADEAPAPAPGKRAAAAPRRLQRAASAPF